MKITQGFNLKTSQNIHKTAHNKKSNLFNKLLKPDDDKSGNTRVHASIIQEEERK
jgi:hypothetical protein